MPATNVRVDQELWSALEAQKPHFLSSTAYLNLIISQALDTSFTLGKPTAAPAEVLPLKAVNKKKDVDFSLRAEEAHVPAEAIKKVKPTQDVPGNLFAHEELIRAYWKAKPKTKSQAAWNLLMRELTKLQDSYGDDVVRDQLVLAEAQRFQSITLKNYEQFGLPLGNAPQQANDSSRFAHLTGMSI